MTAPLGRFRQLAERVPTTAVGLLVIYLDNTPLAEAWFLASRLAYVLFVGISLRAETKSRALSRDVGAEAAWRKFGRRATFLMENDVVALIVACIVTRGTLALPTADWIEMTVGVVLVVVGVGVKVWANASLEKGSWLWRSFFVRPQGVSPSAVGPYRWLRNPMYTVGYLHAYGFALFVGSAPGLVAAAFAQGTILLMNALVERPHVNGDRPPA